MTRPDLIFFFVLNKIKERERDLFSGIFILKSEFFFYVVKKYIPISYLEYPVFDATAANIHIYQNLFSCVLHTANTLVARQKIRAALAGDFSLLRFALIGSLGVAT